MSENKKQRLKKIKIEKLRCKIIKKVSTNKIYSRESISLAL